MIPLAQRVNDNQVWAFPSYDNLPLLWQRMEPLFTSGRRIIWTDRYFSSAELTIEPGLTVRDGIPHFRDNGHSAHIQVLLTPGIRALSLYAAQSEGDECDHEQRYHDKRDGTLVFIEGRGLGRRDRIEVTHYNEYGVGSQTVIAFDYSEEGSKA